MMTKRVEHNNSMLKSNVPCFKFIAIVIVAIVFNSFSVKGAQNNFPVTTDANQAVNGPTNFQWLSIKSGYPIGNNYIGNGFPSFYSRSSTNGLVYVLPAGDSVNADSINGLYRPLYNFLSSEYGIGGFGPYAGAYIAPHIAGGTYATNDFNNWWGLHYVLPNGGTLVYSNLIWSGTTCNVIEVNYTVSNGYGGFKVETNLSRGAFAIANAAIVANITSVGPTAGVYRLTNANLVSSPMDVRITTLSNSVRILGVSFYNYTTNGGIVYNDFAQSGQDIGQFNQIPTNVIGPILRSWDPALVIHKYFDLTNVLTANISAYSGTWDYWPTNADQLWIPPHYSSSPTTLAEGYIMFTNAMARGYNWFGDGLSLFGSLAKEQRYGFLNADLTHLTVTGNSYLCDSFITYLNPFNSANRRWWNNNTRRPMIQDRDFSMGASVYFENGSGPLHAINFRTNSATAWSQLYQDPAWAFPMITWKDISGGNIEIGGWRANGSGGYEFSPKLNGFGASVDLGRLGVAWWTAHMTNINVYGNTITMGDGVLFGATNANPNAAWPNGSIAVTTSGAFWVRTNGTWVQK